MKKKEFEKEYNQITQGLTKAQIEELTSDFNQWSAEKAKEINKDFKSQHKGLRFFRSLMIVVTLVGIAFAFISTNTGMEAFADYFSEFSILLLGTLSASLYKQYLRYRRLLTIEFFKLRINTLYGGNIQLQTKAKHTFNVDLNFRAVTSQDRMSEYIADQKDVSKVLAFLGRLNTMETLKYLFVLLIPAVLLIPCIDMGDLGSINYYNLMEDFSIFKHIELLIKTGNVGDNFDYITVFITTLLLIPYIRYVWQFLKHIFKSMNASSKNRPLVEKNIHLMDDKTIKKYNFFAYLLVLLTRVLKYGLYGMALYATLAYPFADLLNFDMWRLFDVFGDVSAFPQILEYYGSFHSTIMESGINKTPLLLASILYCLFVFMILRIETVTRNNPKFEKILELDD